MTSRGILLQGLIALVAWGGCAAGPSRPSSPGVAGGTPPPPAPSRNPVAAIKLVRHDDQQRVDVLYDDQPFTSYRWEPRLKKPVLYPLRTALGTLITRGW